MVVFRVCSNHDRIICSFNPRQKLSCKPTFSFEMCYNIFFSPTIDNDAIFISKGLVKCVLDVCCHLVLVYTSEPKTTFPPLLIYPISELEIRLAIISNLYILDIGPQCTKESPCCSSGPVLYGVALIAPNRYSIIYRITNKLLLVILFLRFKKNIH